MKTILILLIALSLNASSISCKMANDSYVKDFQYYQFAYNKKSKFEMKWYSTKVLNSLERLMVECPLTEEQTEEAETQQSKLIKIVKAFEGK